MPTKPRPAPVTTDESLEAAKDYAAIIAAAQRPELTVPLVLRADIAVQLQQLRDQIEAARKDAITMADKAEVRKLAKRADELAAAARDATITMLLRGLGPMTFKKLEREHPPVDDDRDDLGLDWHLATFAPALVRACLAGPITVEQWDDLYDNEKITEGQLEELFNVAIQLSRGRVVAPFLPAASVILQGSPESSE